MIISYPRKNGVKYFQDNSVYLMADSATITKYMSEVYPSYVFDSYVTENQRFSNDGQLYYAFYGPITRRIGWSGDTELTETTIEWQEQYGFSKVIKELKILASVSVASGSTVTVTEDTQFNYLGGSGSTATIVIDGVSFIISNSGGNFVWDLGGLGEYNFGSGTTGSISVTVNSKLYTINFTRGSLLFSIVEVGNSPDYFTLPDEVIFSYPSGTTSFLVNTNLPWSISENISWVILDQSYGTGKTTVTGTIIGNNDNVTRTGLTYVTVDSGSIHEVKSILMTQEAEPDYITVSKTGLTYSYSSGLTDNFVITTNLDWTLTESIDWIQFNTYNGTGTTTVTGTIVSGNTTAVRSGLTTITTSLGVVNILITQNYFSVSKTGLTFSYSSGLTDTFVINTNLPWSISESLNWFNISSYSGTGSATITGTTILDNTGTTIKSGNTSIVVNGVTTNILISQNILIITTRIVSSNNYFSLALNSLGEAWGWGGNVYGGLLGDNTTTNRSTPVAVCGNHNFCIISAGQNDSLAIDNLGHAWGWGRNLYGEAGNNSGGNKLTPVAVCGGHTFTAISAGSHISSALDNNGQAWTWGSNYQGGLGNSGTTNKSTPVAVCGNHTFTTISVGNRYCLSVDNLGQAWGWGQNNLGQLGDNSITQKNTPVAVCGGHIFTTISAGYQHSVAIDNLGQAWSWGYNQYGKLGDNTIVNKSTPVAVCGNHTFTVISIAPTDGNHSMAIDNLGQAWGWGNNGNGQLGDNSITQKNTPVAVCGGHTFTAISAGGSHSLAIDNNGHAWGWGNNDTYGKLGNNSLVSQITPVRVCNL